jgi:hypothetical protein
MFKKLSLLLVLCVTYVASSQNMPETNWIDFADSSWYDDSINTFEIADAESLAGISVLVEAGNNFEGKTINLTSDIDLGAHLWLPVGTNVNKSFKGSFDGNDHLISNLFVNRSESDFSALFGALISAEIKNLKIDTAIIYGRGTVAGLAANVSTNSLIENCHVFNAEVHSVSGWDGGIAGGIAGGLLTGSIVRKSSYSGEVYGGNQIGGLVGTAWDTTLIEESYSEGLVSGDDIVGGLVGYCTWNFPPMPNTTNVVKNSFSRSNVIATGGMAGGFYGSPEMNAAIENCYSTGTVTAPNAGGSAGGFIGAIMDGTVANSYFDTESSQMTDGIGQYTPGPTITVVGKTTAEMKSQDLVDLLNAGQGDLWSINPDVNDGYPVLSSFILSADDFITVNNEVIIYPSVSETSINLKTSMPSNFLVTDVNGRILDEGTIQNTEVNYNVSNLNAGVYFVIFENNSSRTVKRFIRK